MTAERRSVPEPERKLILLHTLDQLGPVTDQQLCAFLADCDLMDYFSAQFALLDLTGSRLVTSRPHPLGALILLTDAGRDTLRSFLHRLPASTRETVRVRAENARTSFSTENSVSATGMPLSDGRFCLRMKLIEKEETLLDLTLIRQDRRETAGLQARWEKNSGAVYTLLLSELADGWDPNASFSGPSLPDTDEAAAPGDPAATIFPASDRAGSWLVFLPCGDCFALTLSVPDEAMARYYVRQWSVKGPALAGRIPEILMESDPDTNSAMNKKNN